MASYLAVRQGKHAAGNILREIAGKSPRGYRPRYLGFVIPLADGRGCGRLLGLPVAGLPAALVHHGAAIIRTHSREVRGSIVRELLREGIGMPRKSIPAE
jgi:NADH dehydrogenase FAD-containing subunit